MEGSTEAIIVNFSFTVYGVCVDLFNITFVTSLPVWLPEPVEPPVSPLPLSVGTLLSSKTISLPNPPAGTRFSNLPIFKTKVSPALTKPCFASSL